MQNYAIITLPNQLIASPQQFKRLETKTQNNKKLLL